MLENKKYLASDIWSFGLTVAELLQASHPYYAMIQGLRKSQARGH